MKRLDRPARLDAGGVARALARLGGVVQAKGLKSSSVRDAVARAALRYDGHFTAEELATALRARGVANAHPATVYRVLPLLVEAGLIQEALVAAGQSQRYERAFERPHHDHLVCTSCGKVVEFEFEAIEILQRDLAEQLGFRLTSHIHQLLGVCGRCERAS